MQHALIAGDEITGASTFQLEAGLDTGPVFGVVTEARPADRHRRRPARPARRVRRAAAASPPWTASRTAGSKPARSRRTASASRPSSSPPTCGSDWAKPAVADRPARSAGATPAPGAWTTFRGRRLKLGPVRLARRAAGARGALGGRDRDGVRVGTGTAPVRARRGPGRGQAADGGRRLGPGRAAEPTDERLGGVTRPVASSRPGRPDRGRGTTAPGSCCVTSTRPGAFANLRLPQLLDEGRLDARDRAFATELGYGTLRALGTLDVLIDRHARGRLDPAVRDALRLGAYQLWRTRVPARAAVTTTVDLVRSIEPRASRLANAVLRRIAEDVDAGDLGAPPFDDGPGRVTSPSRTRIPAGSSRPSPTSLDGDWAETRRALEGDDNRPEVHLVARRMARDELLAAAGAGAEPGPWSPGGGAADRRRRPRRDRGRARRAGRRAGRGQPVGGAGAGRGRRPRPAAPSTSRPGPGGKAALLAARGLDVVGLELHPAAGPARRRRPACPVVGRGQPPPAAAAGERSTACSSMPPAPAWARCAGDPEARWRRQPADVGPLAQLQRELLASALRLVRPGGVVAYATCSPHRAETVDVLERGPRGSGIARRPSCSTPAPRCRPGCRCSATARPCSCGRTGTAPTRCSWRCSARTLSRCRPHPPMSRRRPASVCTGMRKLVLTQNVTLDGSPEMLTDWFLPQGQGLRRGADRRQRPARRDPPAGRAPADALLVGRRTFTDFRGYWRDLADDTTGISAYLNRVQKYVVSSTLTEPEWENTTVLDGEPVAAVRRLKEQPGQDIVLTGSIRLSHTLIAAGLVDEYRLFVYPAVQGGGRRLFPDGFDPDRLRLLETQAFRNGVTLTRYATT